MSLLQGSVISGADQSASSAVATAMTSGRKTARAGAKDTSGASGASSTATGTGSSEITSNDFLTLLVSELKNQDPTQPTDPNAYIQQLVGVNSLQQLIQINQEVGAIAPSMASTSTQSS